MPLEGKNTGCAHHTKLNMKPNTMPLLIETMRVDKGERIHLLDLHLERLERSALHLGYPCHIDVIRTAIQAHCDNVTEGVFRLRLTLSHLGELVLEHSELKPTVEPVLVGISDTPLKQSPWLHHKTTNRAWYEQAAGLLQQQPQLFDIVFFNEQGQLCEGSRSNIYVKRNGVWFTPPTDCGLLAGVQRTHLLRTQAVQTAVITKTEFLAADQLRVSNALRGWLDATVVPIAP